MGGPDVGRQYLALGLVDEIGVHIVPVLFGRRTPMFADSIDRHLSLDHTEIITAPSATHLRYRVLTRGRDDR
jgi:dihydrofolate reductase